MKFIFGMWLLHYNTNSKIKIYDFPVTSPAPLAQTKKRPRDEVIPLTSNSHNFVKNDPILMIFTKMSHLVYIFKIGIIWMVLKSFWKIQILEGYRRVTKFGYHTITGVDMPDPVWVGLKGLKGWGCKEYIRN